MANNFKFRPGLADQRRASKSACDFYAATSGRETPAEQKAIQATVKPKQQRAPRQASTAPTEHQEQSALVSWWYRYSATKQLDHRLLVAIPNAQILIGFARDPGAFMGYLKQEGFRKGAADLVLFLPRGRYHALLVEMKRTGGGVLSEEQRDMARIIGEQGYMCMTCYGFEDARVTVMNYLNEAAL